MRLPSKVTPFRDSTLSKLPILLQKMRQGDISVTDLFSAVKGDIDGAAEFINALDCLYAIRRADLNESTKELQYVDGNQM
jgi:hypothetical protein